MTQSRTQTALVHPVVDSLLMGGLSILLFGFVHLWIKKTDDIYNISWIMFYISFIANYPHFMSTYVLLYRDNRSKILRDFKYTWVAVIAPLILASLLLNLSLYSINMKSPRYLGYMANLLYFLVGHHYVKQIYGCIVVSCARTNLYFSKSESYGLKASLFALWFLSFISANINISYQSFYGLTFTTLGFKPYMLQIGYGLTAITFLGFLFFTVKRFIQEKRTMPISAWCAFLSIYLWYIPAFYHPHYLYMIPLFHSLQYLVFVWAYSKNKASHEVQALEPQRRTIVFTGKMSLFILITVITGALAWHYIPRYLDTNFKPAALLGPTLFMFSFQIFLNIHHYIIDNVIWKKENELVRKFL